MAELEREMIQVGSWWDYHSLDIHLLHIGGPEPNEKRANYTGSLNSQLPEKRERINKRGFSCPVYSPE